MSSNGLSAAATEAFDALDAALHTLAGLDWNALPIADLLRAMERLECARRKATACACDLAAVVQHADEAALGESPTKSWPTSCAPPSVNPAAEPGTPSNSKTAPP